MPCNYCICVRRDSSQADIGICQPDDKSHCELESERRKPKRQGPAIHKRIRDGYKREGKMRFGWESPFDGVNDMRILD